MPDEIFNNRPGDNPAPGAYVSADAGPVNYSNSDQRLDLLSQEFQRLRGRLNWLGWLSALALVLAGILAGLLLNMKLQQDRQRQQVTSLTGDKAEVESQINLLAQQVTSLNQQVTAMNQQLPKDLPGQLKVTQAQLKQLQASIQKINSTAVTTAQLNTALQRAQRNVSGGGQTLSPSISPTLPPTTTPSQRR